MTMTHWPNLVTMFFDQAARLGDKPFLWRKTAGQYRPLSWRDTAERVERLARALKAQNVKPGDRLMIVAENRPEWLIADLAAMAAGAISVPAYTTNTVEDHRHIVFDSGAVGAVVSTKALADRFLPAAHESDALRFTVVIDDLAVSQSLNVDILRWQDVLDRHATGEDIAAGAHTLKRTDTACIIYTSGTGGAPKGVMLSHGAILHNCAGATDALIELGLGDEVFLSFLPLSHSYEHTAGQFFPISVGAQIYYAEGIETLGNNMIEAKPTIMTAVPRLYEMLHARITGAVVKQGGVKAKLFFKAVDLGRKRYDNPAALSFAEKFIDALLNKAVRDKVRGRFGGRLKALVSGGAPLNPDIGLFFTALGLTILQGYGQTESAPVASVNRPRKNKIDTVGPPLLDVEVKIAEDGEILIRGELVMQGYWRNEDATREALRDGWLHTGDIGVFDEDRYIKITDRKKDIIVNSGGDNLSPQRVEGLLTLEPEISQAMVYGDKRPHLVGVLVPDAAWVMSWAHTNGKPASLGSLVDDPDLCRALDDAVSRVNKRLSNIEKVRRFIVAPEPFTVDNALMTPTMKIRRHKINEIYRAALEGLYHH
ncbi:MAG: long-chain fatty acid--CoA ligase [Rhodospirillales bacterium]